MENLVYGHWIASAVKMRRGLWNLEKYSLFQGTYSSKYSRCGCIHIFPDSKIYGANMGPTWVLSAPDGPHVGPMTSVWGPHQNVLHVLGIQLKQS